MSDGNKAIAKIFCVATFILAIIFWRMFSPVVASIFCVVVFMIFWRMVYPKELSLSAKNSTIRSGKRAGERMTLIINKMEYAFRWCPAGTFQMGSSKSESNRDDEKQYQVTLSQGFWMQETEVTQEQWESVMGSNPSRFKGNRLPVENVSWNDCQDYMRKLNVLVSSNYTQAVLKFTKLNTAAQQREAVAQGRSLPPIPASVYQFSLPTEAQWEYACRAGSTTFYSFGDSQEQLKDYAWFGAYVVEEGLTASSKMTTNPVGLKKANAWGLYDMHGNVWEWCNDWYGDYPTTDVTDPTGAISGSYRVSCGGCWRTEATFCRSVSRRVSTPKSGGLDLGLRCSLVDKSK